ncbi:ABC transporter ATP-binding protein [Leifsonia sp. Root4]|uniref:dipeptide ABC transporter ATP-binding protein n=1 Tax=Leifsonia sp. Root4 TaxID=1736525 RepID=UPI0006FEB8DE|nr:ABC transporter ATP-binding protein [Leifsonia sp. Root4]KQW03518.1 ABC transporter ATP-binding protein [Leifsonia sp. Root4]
MSLLTITDYTLVLPNGTTLLDKVSLTIAAGETVGLVGESGSGKSLTARSVLGLLPDRAVTSGSVLLDGQEVLGAAQRDILKLRRSTASMVFQDPRAGINPARTIGDHLTETLRLCEGWPKERATKRAVELMEAVRLPRPEDHLRQYPHELSGGMLQRAMIAGALTSSPQLLICDEPTASLDVTTQAGIISVLAEQRRTRNMGMLFITHDLNLAAAICDRVYVLSSGRVEEQGDAREVLSNPQAAYTKRLVAATPSIANAVNPVVPGAAVGAGGQSGAPARLEMREVSKSYERRGKGPITAVDTVSFTLPRGGALGVVGESGSGKSTLARMLVGLEPADSGEILLDGSPRGAIPNTRSERLAHARAVQMVFQDPYLSLDPRIIVKQAIGDAIRLHTQLSQSEAEQRVFELLDQVGLDERHANARPRTLSGGQRQRVAIARALAIEPELLVLDEATSALDVSVQAQVLDVVAKIRAERGLTVLFISHDLAVVRRVCENAVVMHRGQIVERGATAEILENPQHAYTRRLVDSVPRADWHLDEFTMPVPEEVR